MRNGQAYQQKTEKFFVNKEKEFGRIDSRTTLEMQSGELTGSGNETPQSNVLFSFLGQRFESTIGGTRDRAHKEERGSGPGDNLFQKYTPID